MVAKRDLSPWWVWDEIQRVKVARPVAIGLGLATVGLAGMPDLSAWAAVVSLPLVVGGRASPTRC